MKSTIAITGLFCLTTSAFGILFNFDSTPAHSTFPIDVSSEGLNAHLASAGYYNYSIQAADVLGFTPVGFAGNCIYPNTIYLCDLGVDFSKALVDFSIMYAPEEYDCDSSATMRVTAYMDGAYVGTNTATTYAGTWPTGTLTFSSMLGFNRVVIHYDAPPITGGDWGPVFLADNMEVVVDPVPEPATLGVLAMGAVALLTRRGRR